MLSCEDRGIYSVRHIVCNGDTGTLSLCLSTIIVKNRLTSLWNMQITECHKVVLCTRREGANRFEIGGLQPQKTAIKGCVKSPLHQRETRMLSDLALSRLIPSGRCCWIGLTLPLCGGKTATTNKKSAVWRTVLILSFTGEEAGLSKGNETWGILIYRSDVL